MAGRRLWRLVLLPVLLGSVLTAGLLTTRPEPVDASTFGRDLEYGYYDGKRYSKGAPDYYWYSYMFETGLPANYVPGQTTVDLFISDLRTRLFASDTIDQARASMLINVMMGVQAQDPRYDGPNPQNYQNGIQVARSQFSRWESIVRDYSNCTQGVGRCRYPGASVNFNEIYNLDDTINGYGVAQPNDGPQIPEVVFAPIGGSNEEMIVFRHPNGTTFTIKKKCGNLTGEQSSFPNSPPSGEINPPTPAEPNKPPGYSAGDTKIYSSCFRVTGWARDPNNAAYRVPVTIRYRIGSNPPITMPSTQAANTSPFAFGQDTPAAVRTSTQPVRVTASGVASNGLPFDLGGDVTLGPCRIITAACNGITWSPSALDPGTPYSITARIGYGTAADAGVIFSQPGGIRFFMTIQGPGVNRSITSITPVVNEGGGVLRATTLQQPPTGQTGVYNVSYGIAAGQGAITCSGNGSSNPGGTFPVYARPYFQVTNGEVSAGSGMSVGGANCAVDENANAGIVSWNRGVTGSYGGAGTNFSALALGRLQGFATGQGSSLAPDGAAFANNADGQVNTAGGLFGGRFGGLDCTTDYLEGVPDASVQSGNLTLGAQTIPSCNGTNTNACRRAVYVKGNVYITGNITFAGSGGYAGMAAIPAFSVIATGNIYIAPGVTQLDGFYVAQPSSASSTDGVIYTCAPTPYVSAALDRYLSSACGSQLNVTGSFVGRQIWLLRTSGTLSGAPAEVFNYSPETWLSAPYGNGLTGNDGEYDAITSLPPVL